MKATITQKDLAKALNAVERAAPKKSNLPILSHVLLDAEDGWLVVTATDLAVTIRSAAPADTIEHGKATVSADMLSSWLDLQDKGGKIELAQHGTKIRLSCGRAVSNLGTGDPDEFPLAPNVDEHDPSAVEIDPKALELALAEVLHAAATNDSRPQLAGIFIELTDGAVHLTGCDGFKMANASITRHVTAQPGAKWSAIVPVKTMSEVQRLVKDIEDPVHIASAKSHVRFQVGTETVIYGRLLAGTYPDWRRLLEVNRTNLVEVDRLALVRAVRVATLFADADNHSIRIQRDESGGLGIFGTSAEHDGTESIEAEFTGEPWVCSVNGTYLKDALDALPDPRVVLVQTPPGNKVPLLVLPSDRTGSTQLVMPVIGKSS